jgi:SAM-dependent methyltransferase
LTSLSWPDTLFAARDRRLGAGVLRSTDGTTITLAVGRWHQPASEDDEYLLSRTTGAVLDVGCGPGRHVLALVNSGRHALGIDTSAAAVATARDRGAPAVVASVFGEVPGTGSWDTVLLLDGNIGIGGDPVVLLRRIASLLRPTGVVFAELGAPKSRRGRFRVRVEHAGRSGHWFAWASVSADQAPELATASGFALVDRFETGGRWFAVFARMAEVGDGF